MLPELRADGKGSVRRVEDQRFITGRARYVDDIDLAHCDDQKPHSLGHDGLRIAG